MMWVEGGCEKWAGAPLLNTRPLTNCGGAAGAAAAGDDRPPPTTHCWVCRLALILS